MITLGVQPPGVCGFCGLPAGIALRTAVSERSMTISPRLYFQGLGELYRQKQGHLPALSRINEQTGMTVSVIPVCYESFQIHGAGGQN